MAIDKTNAHINSIIVAILYWIADSVQFLLGMQPDFNVTAALLPVSSSGELIPRLLITGSIIGLGFYVKLSISYQKLATSQLLDILDSTNDAYLSVDQQMNIVYLNKQAEELLQVDADSVLGNNLWDAFPEGASTFYKPLLKASKTSCDVSTIAHYSAIDRWIEINIHPGRKGVSMYFKDITERKLLDESNRKLKNIIGFASDGIVTINSQGIIESINDATERIFGYTRKELIGKKVNMLMNEEDARDHDSYIQRYLKTGISSIINIGPREVIAKRKDGSSFPLDLSLGNMQFGEKEYFIGIVRDITERIEAREQLQYLSNYDQLTQLPNRMLFTDRLGHAIVNAKRNESRLVVMFIDLDGFKAINDTFGHAAGDMVLKRTAERLTGCLRESDSAARLSGDEFVVLLENVDADAEVDTVANKILSTISQPMDLNDRQIAISSSIGISVYPEHGEDTDSLLNLADTAMYQAKNTGKNSYMHYSHNKTG